MFLPPEEESDIRAMCINVSFISKETEMVGHYVVPIRNAHVMNKCHFHSISFIVVKHDAIHLRMFYSSELL